MSDKISVDTSKLLGFDKDGDALFGLVKATGDDKGVTRSKVDGLPKMTGLGGKGEVRR